MSPLGCDIFYWTLFVKITFLCVKKVMEVSLECFNCCFVEYMKHIEQTKYQFFGKLFYGTLLSLVRFYVLAMRIDISEYKSHMARAMGHCMYF
jgi:hypothetical protein